MAKKQANFRLPEETLRDIESLQNALGCKAQADVIVEAVSFVKSVFLCEMVKAQLDKNPILKHSN